MDRNAVKRIMGSTWEPILYTRSDLETLLVLSAAEADHFVFEITGDQSEPGVVHHDLVSYLRDITSIAQVPDSEVELPTQGLWLLDQGWKLNPSRNTFRWICPYLLPNMVSFSLRTALKIELKVQFAPEQQEGVHPVEDDDDIMDAEFEIVGD